MKYKLYLWTILTAAIASSNMATAQLQIATEAYKSAIVDIFAPDDAGIQPFPEQTLPGTNYQLSYISFDLSRLPGGSRIAEARINVFDAEPNFSDDFNTIGLLDVESDWESSSLSFNSAVENYGAAINQDGDGNDVVGFNPDKLLWSGKAKMDNLDAPGQATVGSTRMFESFDPFNDQQFVDALNEELANGDGLITLAIYGDFPYDNYMVGIDYADGEAGPTLTVTLADDSDLGFRTVYNFDNGDLDGWVAEMQSTTENGPTQLGLISSEDAPVGDSVPPLPLSGTSFIGPVPFEAEGGDNTRDRGHQTLLIRSPEFRIYPNGQISFSLIGGAKPGFDIDTINAEGLPAESSGSGSIGVALREVSSGNYLTFNTRTDNGGQFWETITLDEEVLADIVSEEESYTLDFIDYHSGGWGWAGLDSVVIQEGTPVRNYNFDDQTLQGWTVVGSSATEGGPTQLGVISEGDPAVGNSVPPLPLSSPSFIGPVPFEAEDGTNTRDNAHETLIVRSPEFTIYPNGQISFALIGGSKPGLDLDEVNANGLPATSSGSGHIGVALREVSTGDYLTFNTRSDNGGQFWETITLGEETLSGLVKDSEKYTLDFIDYHSGGWGWAGLDSVQIRQGTPDRNYNFDDGTTQGWATVTPSTTEGGPTMLGPISTDDPAVGDSVPPLPLSPKVFIGPVPFEAEDNTNTRDQAHQTLVFRSPEFNLYKNGQISFALIGGSKPLASLDDLNANGLPADSSGSGSIGVALRNVSTDEYLTFNTRSDNGGQFWETITLDESVLSGVVDEDSTYTLDFIDFHSGGWGWAGLDNVSIKPGRRTSGPGTGGPGETEKEVMYGMMPIVPEGLTDAGEPYQAPGVYPYRLTAANVDISLAPGTILGGDGSNDMKVMFPSMGPIDWTDARHNEGDIAFNIGAAQPGITAPDEFKEHRPGGGEPLDGTTFAWTVDNRQGVGFVTTRANGFDNEDVDGNGDPVGTQYGVAYFSHQFRSGFGYSPIDGVFGNGNFASDTLLGLIGEPDEGVFDIALSWFPYSEGWTGGQISGDFIGDPFVVEAPVQFYNAENGGSIGYGVDPSSITWIDYNDDFEINDGLARLALPGVENADLDGMLFVAPTHSSSNTKIAGATPVGDAWHVTIRDDRTFSDDNTLAPRDQSGFSFLYLPWNTTDLVGGYINGDDAMAFESAGEFTMEKEAEGIYNLTITGKTGDDGVLILGNAGSMEAGFYTIATPAFFSYEYDAGTGVFVINSNELTFDGVVPVDSDFYFAWVDFESPMSPAPMEAPRLIQSVPFGDTYLLDPSDISSVVPNSYAGLAINTKAPEILVTTVFNGYNNIDIANAFGFLFDPISGEENIGVLIGYRVNSITGARIGEPFIILGNPNGEIQKNDVKYNPVTDQYVVVAEARGISANGLNIPVIALVNSAAGVDAGGENVAKVVNHDNDAADHQYQDVGLAVSSKNGNFMIVAEFQQEGFGEGVSGAIYDQEANLLSKVVNRLDTIAQDRDEDDPDVSYAPMADMFIFNTNIDPVDGEPNRISLTAVQTMPDANGDLVTGAQQIVSNTRVEATSQGHPSAVENPFNGEFIVAFDYANGAAGGDLVYLRMNDDLSFTETSAQVPYLEATGGDPFNHRHPQIGIDTNRCYMLLAHNANGGNRYPGVVGMAFTILDEDGQILPGRSETFFGFHGFSRTEAGISNDPNHNNVQFDPFSRKFYSVVNDQTGVTRLISLSLEVSTSDWNGSFGGPVEPEEKTIFDLVLETEDLSTLRTALNLAGLAGVLNGDDQFTVFAPVNSAFDAIDDAVLDGILGNNLSLGNILTFHVVAGKVMSQDIVLDQDITTVRGETFQVTQDASGNLKIGDATIVQVDIQASNGVVHLIDRVLLPSVINEIDSMGLVDITAPGDEIVTVNIREDGTHSPAGEEVDKVIDNETATKYLNRDGVGSGFIVTPAAGSSVVMGLSITSGNDSASFSDRNPTSYLLEGSNDGSTFVEIASGAVPSFSDNFQTRYIVIANEAAYTTYRLTFPTLVGSGLMQVSEVELLALPVGGGLSFTSVQVDNGQLVLSFTGKLQSSPSVDGPWTDVAGADGSYRAAIEEGALFFRVVE